MEQTILDADKVSRFIFENHGVRGEIVKLNDTIVNLLAKHNYKKCVEQLLKELSLAASLIAATLKSNDEIMIQIQGKQDSSALRFAAINMKQDLSLYGSASLYDNEISDNVTFKELIGEGACLILTVFPKEGKQWQGIIPLDKENLKDCIEEYFKNSEQLNTKLYFYTNESSLCAAILLQIIPLVEGNDASLEHLSVLTDTMTYEEITSLPFYDSLHRLFWNDDAKYFEPATIKFKCTCSKERCLNTIATLDKSEIEEMIKDGKDLTITCQHCLSTYTITIADLKELLNK